MIPIPNFTPNGRIGLAGALSDAYSISGNGVGGMGVQGGNTFLASQDGREASGIVNPKVLAQMNQLAPGNMALFQSLFSTRIMCDVRECVWPV